MCHALEDGTQEFECRGPVRPADSRRHRVQGGVGTLVPALALAYFLGIDPQVLLQMQQDIGPPEARLADFVAGLWGYHAERSRQLLEQCDIEVALNAATAIGDDRLQKQAQGYVIPESFTHGTSRQRVEWFRRGIESGDFARCNTFGA